MANVKPTNDFQWLFAGLEYFDCNAAKEEIKKSLCITEQTWNRWWRGDGKPQIRKLNVITDIISKYKRTLL